MGAVLLPHSQPLSVLPEALVPVGSLRTPSVSLLIAFRRSEASQLGLCRFLKDRVGSTLVLAFHQSVVALSGALKWRNGQDTGIPGQDELYPSIPPYFSMPSLPEAALSASS